MWSGRIDEEKISRKSTGKKHSRGKVERIRQIFIGDSYGKRELIPEASGGWKWGG